MINEVIPNFDWCKKFDVKDPYISTPKSIGTDLFMPKLTDEFLKEFAEQNEFVTKKINGGILYLEKSITKKFEDAKNEKETIIKNIKASITDEDELKRNIAEIEGRYANVLNLIEKNSIVCIVDEKRTQILINKLCIIPSGIMIDCPEDYYYDVRRKSASNRANRRIMLGTIDEDYTYSVGVEIKPDNNRQVRLMPDEKIAQIVFHKKQLTWSHSNQISYDAFVNKDSVKAKREMRKGGWGSTGLK